MLHTFVSWVGTGVGGRQAPGRKRATAVDAGKRMGGSNCECGGTGLHARPPLLGRLLLLFHGRDLLGCPWVRLAWRNVRRTCVIVSAASPRNKEWGARIDPAQVPVLLLPYPIAVLVCNGLWSDLVLLTRFHRDLDLVGTLRRRQKRQRAIPGPLAGWPPETSTAWPSNCGQDGAGVQEGGDGDAARNLTPEALEQIASDIQRWSSPILAAATAEDAGGERASLEDAVRRLQGWSDSLRDAAGSSNKAQGSAAKLKHSSARLFECIRCSRSRLWGLGPSGDGAAQMPMLLAFGTCKSVSRRFAGGMSNARRCDKELGDLPTRVIEVWAVVVAVVVVVGGGWVVGGGRWWSVVVGCGGWRWRRVGFWQHRRLGT